MRTMANTRCCLIALLSGSIMLAADSAAVAQFDVVTIGDSWASFIADGAPGSGDLLPGHGNAFQNVLNAVAPGTTVYNGGFYGDTAATHAQPGKLADITSRVNASGADVVYLSTGGNDIILTPGWDLGLSPGDEQNRANAIAGNVNTVVNHILSIRPDIQVVIAGYDYPNLWDPELSGSPGSPGNILRDQYGLGLQGTPFGILDGAPISPAVDIGGNAEFNNYFRLVEQGKIDIANNSRRVHHVNNFGLLNRLNGYNGYFGSAPPGLPQSAYDDLPYSPSRLGPGNDPIHTDTTGYEQITANAYNQFLGAAFADNASLALTTTTLAFGNVRIGTDSSLGTTASNAGADFSKVQGLAFAAASGDFSGSSESFDPLFRDPLLASDTASKSYGYAPTDRGADAQNISVSSSHGAATLSLTGAGVGPEFAADQSTIHFGSWGPGSTAMLDLQIENASPDADLGALTDLTIISASIVGTDAGLFSLLGFTPGTILDVLDDLALQIEFNALGPLGGKSATLIFQTDQDAAFGAAGTSFQIPLSGHVVAVPEPSTLHLAGCALVIAILARRRRRA